ncbi:MAG: substrate-binding domain-containing protein [Devosia sp.]|nr:substrate-binding domain-containing protein [Devosia sp.]
MTTLRELAQHLGLSPATVSRALNGFPEVGEKTRIRVLEASERLRYKANSNAKRLATGKSGMVGMIFRSSRNLLVDPHFVDFLAGLSTGLADREIDLVIHAAPQHELLAHYERFVSSGSVDGMIVSAPELNDRRIATLIERGFPFVVHGRTGDNVGYAYFDIDNGAAFKAATSLLIDLGHRCIALLNGEADLAFVQQREEAFRQATTDRGIHIPERFISHDVMSEEQGFAHATEMLSGRRGPAPTAFLCSSTLQALGVIRAAATAELTVGTDLSIIAHDDVLPHLRPEHFNPALTVTRSPIRMAGVALAEMMVARISGVDPLKLQRMVTADLIVRASTGAAPTTGRDGWLH